VAYVAVTVRAGDGAGQRCRTRLVVRSAGGAAEVPVRVEVGAGSESTDLWYVCPDMTPRRLNAALTGKLARYGVDVLALRLDDRDWRDSLGALIGRAERAGISTLAVVERGAGAPSTRTALAELFGESVPVYLLPAGDALAARMAELRGQGLLPAVLCDVPARPVGLGLDQADGAPAHFLLADGAYYLGEAPARTWAFRDLRGADWRGAARQLGRALADPEAGGLAVMCDLPLEPVDEQLAIWHVIRDACERTGGGR
jgi:hypothetical protein